MSTIRITDATFEPVTLAEAKAHLRVDTTDEDSMITRLITVARHEAEHLTGRALCLSTWRLHLDAFPSGAIQLLNPPLVSVVHIKYYDTAGVQQTVTSTDYMLDTTSAPGWVAPVPTKTWPSTQERMNAVEVQYTAGWANAGAVPVELAQWVLLRIGTLFAHREQVTDGVTASEVPFANGLLDTYRVYG